jgi:tetratricopeptide (TPR) repeat protein
MMGKQHRRFAAVLIVMICIAMITSGGAMYFSGSGLSPAGSSPSTNGPNSVAEYQAQKIRLAAVAERAKADPSNVMLQNDLGKEYYEAGVAAQSAVPTEAPENFRSAVEAYQNVLKINKDPDVMVDMATAAFQSGDNDLAEKSFREALTIKPDFYNGLVNYGVFLASVKQDLAGAISQWQKAQSLAPDSSEKARLSTLISQAQSQLKAPLNNGASNPAAKGTANPTSKNGETSPASTGK